MKALSLYRNHRKHAAERCIKFEFEFAEWIQWWADSLGPDWMLRRGGHGGKYVMARYGDKGPYRAGNVYCTLFEENLRDKRKYGSAARGVGVGIAVLNDGLARAIFQAEGTCGEISKQLNVHRDLVRYIKKKNGWAHATVGLKPGALRVNDRLSRKKVRSIFLAKGEMNLIAKKYGKTTVTIRSIKERRSWASVTADLS